MGNGRRRRGRGWLRNAWRYCWRIGGLGRVEAAGERCRVRRSSRGREVGCRWTGAREVDLVDVHMTKSDPALHD